MSRRAAGVRQRTGGVAGLTGPATTLSVCSALLFCCLCAGWDDWSATVKPVGGPAPKAAPAASAGMGGNLAKQHSLSSPALHSKDEDDWGKW